LGWSGDLIHDLLYGVDVWPSAIARSLGSLVDRQQWKIDD